MSLIKGRYRIIETIGRGGFGETFLTIDEDVPSKRKCVVKQLKPLLGPATDDTKERFKQEAEVLEKLGNEHGQIPKLYDYFDEAGEFYLVQEFIAGKTVGQLIKEKAICDEEKVRRFLLDLLSVLDFVHKRKIIHRDIKPDNIIIRESDGKPVLIDFGLVKQVVNSEIVSHTVQAGTRGFMAVEQMNGLPVYASDLFSVGMTAIAMLTPGFQLKPDSQTGEVYWKNLVKGGLSGELGDILDKATELRVTDRFRSASEMLSALFEGETQTPFLGLFPPTTIPKTGDVRIVAEGVKVAFIPAGFFEMGSPESEDGREENETPVHLVEITKPFWIGKYQVTQAQWKAVMGSNPSSFDDCPQCPVESVSWIDCQEFIRKLNDRKDGNVYRLPTEAEWEYACRAGTRTPFSLGTTITPEQVNFDGNYPYSNEEVGQFREKTVPVGSLNSPNPWGLHDMHGNVWEWCNDWIDENYYKKSPEKDPKGPETGIYRVLRGGSWDDFGKYCRSADRGKNTPTKGHNYSGFRICCS